MKNEDQKAARTVKSCVDATNDVATATERAVECINEPSLGSWYHASRFIELHHPLLPESIQSKGCNKIVLLLGPPLSVSTLVKESADFALDLANDESRSSLDRCDDRHGYEDDSSEICDDSDDARHANPWRRTPAHQRPGTLQELLVVAAKNSDDYILWASPKRRVFLRVVPHSHPHSYRYDRDLMLDLCEQWPALASSLSDEATFKLVGRPSAHPPVLSLFETIGAKWKSAMQAKLGVTAPLLEVISSTPNPTSNASISLNAAAERRQLDLLNVLTLLQLAPSEIMRVELLPPPTERFTLTPASLNLALETWRNPELADMGLNQEILTPKV